MEHIIPWEFLQLTWIPVLTVLWFFVRDWMQTHTTHLNDLSARLEAKTEKLDSEQHRLQDLEAFEKLNNKLDKKADAETLERRAAKLDEKLDEIRTLIFENAREATAHVDRIARESHERADRAEQWLGALSETVAVLADREGIRAPRRRPPTVEPAS